MTQNYNDSLVSGSTENATKITIQLDLIWHLQKDYCKYNNLTQNIVCKLKLNFKFSRMCWVQKLLLVLLVWFVHRWCGRQLECLNMNGTCLIDCTWLCSWYSLVYDWIFVLCKCVLSIRTRHKTPKSSMKKSPIHFTHCAAKIWTIKA